MSIDRPIGPDRMLRRLTGHGIEIGAFQAPQFLPDGDVTYVDVLSREEALRFYPEVPECVPAVRPDILARADDLEPLADDSQDFVIASHVLEHTEDAVGTLRDWHRVLKPGGLLYLCLPDMRHTFDASRERTRLEHLIRDHVARGTAELERRNQAHYLEWAEKVSGLHDARQAALWAELLASARYPIHFHCWVPEDIIALVKWLETEQGLRFDILDQEVMREGHEFAFLLGAGGPGPKT